MFELFNHQKELLDKNPKKHALVWEMGTGKTIGSLALVNKNCDSFLVICPLGLVKSWEKAINKFPFDKKKDFFVISKETFRRDHLKLQKYQAVIVDECHWFLGMKSGLMKSLRKYFHIHEIEYRYLLSGTVYRSSPFDVYILSMLLGKPLNYFKFFNDFFYNVRMGNRMIPMPKKNIEDDIANIVQSLGNTVKLEECVNMPAKNYKEEYFELNKEQKEAIINLDITSPIVRFTKIHQICGGTIKGDEYVDDQVVKSDKTNRLIEVCEEISKVIVVCRYNNEITMLFDKLQSEFPNRKIKFINGTVSGEDREEILQDLEKTNSYILLVNAAVSEGWQLQNCCHMIFYSYDFQLKNKLQMEARLTRIDAPRPTFYLSLITKNTIDESIYKTLQSRLDFHLAIYNQEL